MVNVVLNVSHRFFIGSDVMLSYSLLVDKTVSGDLVIRVNNMIPTRLECMYNSH